MVTFAVHCTCGDFARDLSLIEAWGFARQHDLTTVTPQHLYDEWVRELLAEAVHKISA